MDPVVFVCVKPIPRLGIQVGDRVLFDPGAPEQIALWRPLRNSGAVLGETIEGTLQAMTPIPSLVELARAVGSDWQPPEPSVPAEASRSLKLVK